MNKLYLCFFLVLICCKVYCQNLVPNPSFEDTLYCPVSFGDLYSIKYWHKPTQGSADYFNICNVSDVEMPNNGFGYQNARTGNGYSGVANVFDSITANNYREYIQVKLTDSLILNKKYIVSFFINKSDSTPIAITNMGAYISKTPVGGSFDTQINVLPQIQNPQGVYLTDTSNWVEINDTLVATGGEQYITIGCFTDNVNTDTLSLFFSQNYYFQSYYYIDDVSIVENLSNSIATIKNDFFNQTFIFPNPTKNNFNIKTNSIIESLELINEYGTCIKVFPCSARYDISNISNGIYVIKINNKNSSIYKKLIINR